MSLLDKAAQMQRKPGYRSAIDILLERVTDETKLAEIHTLLTDRDRFSAATVAEVLNNNFDDLLPRRAGYQMVNGWRNNNLNQGGTP